MHLLIAGASTFFVQLALTGVSGSDVNSLLHAPNTDRVMI